MLHKLAILGYRDFHKWNYLERNKHHILIVHSKGAKSEGEET